MTQDLDKTHSQHLQSIKEISSLNIVNWKYLDDGFDSYAYEINGEWIFKIPRRSQVWGSLQEEKRFLDSFKKVSPLSIPEITYFDYHIVGYKKIQGESLTSQLFDSLSKNQKSKIAHDLGIFLNTLHSFNFDSAQHTEYRNFFNPSGYKKFVAKLPQLLFPLITKKANKNIKQFLSDFESNQSNLIHIQGTVHSDLYANHIFWDSESECMSGIIDFGGITTNAITSDFTMMINFKKPENDNFLKLLLNTYNSKDSDLFRKIKLFSKIETLYWPIESIEDAKLEPDLPNDLEKNLEDVEYVFGKAQSL